MTEYCMDVWNEGLNLQPSLPYHEMNNVDNPDQYEVFCMFYEFREAVSKLDVSKCENILAKNISFINSHLDGLSLLLITCSIVKECDKLIEIARLLLKNGADPEARRNDSMTPLMIAIEARNRKLVTLLIEYGANVHAKFFDGSTPLHFAASAHDKDIFINLLRSGSDPFVANNSLYSPLHIAVEENFKEGTLLMLEAAGEKKQNLINMRLVDGSTAIFAAVRENNSEILNILLENGGNCNITMQPVWSRVLSGLHAVTVAAKLNHLECIRIMLPYIDREVVASTELDPISAAAFAGSKECVEIMIRENFNIEGKTIAPPAAIIEAYLRPIFARKYYTPLREAVRKGHADIVKLLLAAGAKAFYPAKCYSPFLYSFRTRIDPTIMFHFIEHGLDLNKRSYNTLFDAPDVLLAVLGGFNRWHLVHLLKCGLNPSLEKWCSCSNKFGRSLLENVRQASYVKDFPGLLSILLIFSPCVPSCCNAVVNAAKFRGPRIFPLMHMCRMKLRSRHNSADLLSGEWMNGLNLPPSLQKYLSFDSFEFSFT